MKPLDTPSKTGDPQTYGGTRRADAAHTVPTLKDDGTQLDAAIIHQMVVDALRAVATSGAERSAGRQRPTQPLVP